MARHKNAIQASTPGQGGRRSSICASRCVKTEKLIMLNVTEVLPPQAGLCALVHIQRKGMVEEGARGKEGCP